MCNILACKYTVQLIYKLEEEDPFADIDDTVRLGSLIHSAMGGSSCSVEEYVIRLERMLSLCVLTLIVKTGKRIG